MLGGIMQKLLKGTLWTIVLSFLLYCWLGFLAIPGLGLHFGNQLLQQYTREPAHLQRLEFNPLSLELRLWQLAIGQEPAIALDAAHARLDWNNLFRGRVHISEAVLQQPFARIELDENRELTLLQLFDLPPGNDEPREEQPAFPLTLAQARIEQGSVAYLDRSLQQPVDILFENIQVQASDFSLDQDIPARFELALTASDGTELQADGDFALQSMETRGQLQADKIALASWWPYVREQLELQLNSGTLQLDTAWHLQLEPELQVITDNLNLQLDELELANVDNALLLKAGQLQVAQAGMDLAAQQVNIQQVTARTLHAPLLVNKDGTLNWEKISPPSAAVEQIEEAVEPVIEEPAAGLAQIPWHVRLQQLAVTDSRVQVQLDNQPEPVALDFTGLGLQVSGFDSRSDEPVGLQLATRLGEQGTIDLSAEAHLQSLAGTAQLKTANLDLRTAKAWIRPYARIELLSAALDSDLKTSLKSIEPLDFSLSGDVQVNKLHIRDDEQHRDLLKWQALKLEKITFSQADSSQLQIGRIHAVQPYARLVIDENLDTNINKVLVPQPESPADDSQAADFRFELGEILVEEGSANFADFSLKPHFATAIEKLNGRIGTLASGSTRPTPVDIKGAVDNYAPVSISGSLTPFDPLEQLDIVTSFKRVELTALTPYSGKFAGYRIQKGRLNLDLHYQISEGQLNASNSVLLEQLQLGEKVESSDAVDLPIRLAVAMLKDTKGNIDIQLPVTGDMNSPEFSVMPIVWQTLRNLLTRAVSSPFRMLAGIGNAGDDDLGQIPFAPGATQLNEHAAALLDSLAGALQQRPLLKLNIEGTSAAAHDGPALAERMLQRRYQELWYQHLQERGKPLPDDIYSLEVSERNQEHLLEQIYETMLQEGKVEAMPSLPRKERHGWQRQQVLQEMAANPLFLRTLAQQRAAAIRSHLVEQGGIDVERLFLLDVNENAEPDNGMLNSQLHLDVL